MDASATGLAVEAMLGISFGRGKLAALDEGGYQLVAAMQSDEEMKEFILRILAASGRKVREGQELTLSGMVPFYSGTEAVQDFQRLQDELRVVPWVQDVDEDVTDGVSGVSAPLNETGYQKVAELKSDNEMASYVRRVLKAHKLALKEGKLGDFNGVVKYYSGTRATQSFLRLQEELKHAQWVDSLKLEGTSMVQQKARKLRRSAPTVEHEEQTPVAAPAPAVSLLEESPKIQGSESETFNTLTSEVDNLKAHLLQARKESEAVEAEKRAAFEQKLSVLKQNYTDTMAMNAGIVKEISRITGHSEELRKRAESLEQGNADLRMKLEVIAANITVMEDFVSGTLNDFNLSKVPETSVLAELAKEEATRARLAAQKERLDEIASAARKGSSLLEIRAQRGPFESKLLATLQGSMEDLKREQAKRLEALEEDWSNQLKFQEHLIEKLQEEQKKLRSEKEQAESLESRLDKAVSFLEKTRASLQERLEALRAFTSRVGQAAQASPAKAAAEKEKVSLADVKWSIFGWH